jgi:CheY-like chemotaxis protein
MPVMNGMQSTRAIRAFEKEHLLPPTTIIALTGQASLEAQNEAHDPGFNLFISKPAPLKKVKALVEEKLAIIKADLSGLNGSNNAT